VIMWFRHSVHVKGLNRKLS